MREERRKAMALQVAEQEKQMKYDLRNNQKQTLLG